MENLSDGELVRRTLQGQNEAYGELVRRCQDGVFNVCYRMLGERREAEDLAQEALLRGYQRLASFDSARPFGPWIRRVAANLCLNHLKATANTPEPLEEPEALPAAPEDDPAALQEQAEGAQTLRRMIASLPPSQRAVIELNHFQGLSYLEIAQELALPLSDVKSYLFRARRLLAQRIHAHEPDPTP